ncbi:MAG: hypothetical protein V9G20_14905 [Candidatus Promineifilaceae bacterium]
MRTETLYSSYHPIQQYRQLLTHMLGEDTHPVLELRAIDAFLMKQMVSSYPIKPTVIDVAAAPTLGTSTIFWAAHPGIQHLYIMPTGDPESWHPLVTGAMTALDLPGEEITFCDGNWATLQEELNPLCPPMAMLGVDEGPGIYLARTPQHRTQPASAHPCFSPTPGRYGQQSRL